MRTVRILTVLNGVGLQRDTEIVKRLCEQAGCEVYVADIYKHVDHRHFDLNIHLEIVSEHHIHRAYENWLIPNPEWFMQKWVNKLRFFKKVLCKTHDCERIFKELGCQTVYTSFTSDDRQIEAQKQRIFFHNQGKSAAKNTDAIIQAWDKFTPGVSCVIVGQKPQQPHQDVVHCGYLEEDEFKVLQNTCLFHICPSQYEGFGHYIWEALSCGNIVISTNAAPMNEFIDESFGVLVDPSGFHRQHFGNMHHVTPEAINEAVKSVLTLSDDKIKEMSTNARLKWEQNDKFFKEAFLKELSI